MNKIITPLPPANFTPEMGEYKTLQPFRYWCQKVLPLVYDDSLSYYELLCKVVDYLNKTMEDVETLHGDVTNIHNAYNKLQNYVNDYFSTLDVQEEINHKLDNMVKDGELLNIITPTLTSTVNAWLNTNIEPSTGAIDKTLSANNAGANSLTVGNLFDFLIGKSVPANNGPVYTTIETGKFWQNNSNTLVKAINNNTNIVTPIFVKAFQRCVVKGAYNYFSYVVTTHGFQQLSEVANDYGEKVITKSENFILLLSENLSHSTNHATVTCVENNYLNTIIDNNDNKEYTRQVYDGNQVSLGLYNHSSKKVTPSSNSYIVKPYPIYKGRKYTLKHVYGYFCNILYGSTCEAITENTWGDYPEYTFVAEDNGWLLITIHPEQLYKAQIIDGDSMNETYYYGTLEEEPIDIITDYEKTINVKKRLKGGYYNRDTGYVQFADTAYYMPPYKIKRGRKYTITHCYGYFTLVGYNGVLTPITNETWGDYPEYTFVAEDDGLLYLTVHKDMLDSVTFVDGSNVATNLKIDKTLWWKSNTLKLENTSRITVGVSKQFSTIVSAVNYAKLNGGGDIYIDSGTYDIFNELGGEEWLKTVTSGELNGLDLTDSNINLIGVGNVILTMRLPDTVTKDQSSRISCVNLSRANNELRNLTIIGKNCRYAMHDEGNGGNYNVVHKVKNCKFIHEGNIENLWEYPTVMGGGTTGGSYYEYECCEFINKTYNIGISYHNNYAQKPSTINIKNCVSKVVKKNQYDGAFRFSYYGTNNKEDRVTIFVSNCFGNTNVYVGQEGSTPSTNVVDLYKSAYTIID